MSEREGWPTPPKYGVGSPVRVRGELGPGPILTPRWLYGKPGVIADVRGKLPDPGRLAHGAEGPPPVPRYFVAFEPRDVLGDRAPQSPRLYRIYAELSEHWLEPR